MVVFLKKKVMIAEHDVVILQKSDRIDPEESFTVLLSNGISVNIG